ncbi:hypothetical protein ABZ359_32025 [Streptomyces sp. NPDC005968]|uniref:hypothetical protein n=1 Tax=Streptomyces sp. NPDC005968 TaxID=3154574 RepID=UPI0033DE7182
MSTFSPGETAGAKPLAEIAGSFEPLLQIGKPSVDAPGVGRQKHQDPDPGPLGHLDWRQPVAEPCGQARVRQGGMPGQGERVALGTALQLAFFVKLPPSVHCLPISGVAVRVNSSSHWLSASDRRRSGAPDDDS